MPNLSRRSKNAAARRGGSPRVPLVPPDMTLLLRHYETLDAERRIPDDPAVFARWEAQALRRIVHCLVAANDDEALVCLAHLIAFYRDKLEV